MGPSGHHHPCQAAQATNVPREGICLFGSLLFTWNPAGSQTQGLTWVCVSITSLIKDYINIWLLFGGLAQCWVVVSEFNQRSRINRRYILRDLLQRIGLYDCEDWLGKSNNP